MAANTYRVVLVHHQGHENLSTYPDQRIPNSLFEPAHQARLTLICNRIHLHSNMRKFSLGLTQPPSCKRVVRQIEESDDSDHKGHHSLKDEQPLPPCQVLDTVESVEDSSCNESCEGCGEDVACVEDCDACGDFFAGVPSAEEVNGAGVDCSECQRGSYA